MSREAVAGAGADNIKRRMPFCEIATDMLAPERENHTMDGKAASDTPNRPVLAYKSR